jgi:hypothetical protein
MRRAKKAPEQESVSVSRWVCWRPMGSQEAEWVGLLPEFLTRSLDKPSGLAQGLGWELQHVAFAAPKPLSAEICQCRRDSWFDNQALT